MTHHERQADPEVPTFPFTDVPLTGTIAGLVPYDFTAPTPAKIRERLWNPHSERVLGPHTFGIGWAPNFGALAVQAGLIEPDAEDDPLDTFPGEAWAATLAVPAALAGIAVLGGKDVPKPAQVLLAAGFFGVVGAAFYGLAVAGREVEKRRDLG